MNHTPDCCLPANWPAPPGVRAVTTLRHGAGISQPPFEHFNLGQHAGDVPEAVAHNRAELIRRLALPSPPCWLRQVHGTRVQRFVAPGSADTAAVEADAAVTSTPGVVLAILTADCLPVTLAARDGTPVGAAWPLACWNSSSPQWRPRHTPSWPGSARRRGQMRMKSASRYSMRSPFATRARAAHSYPPEQGIGELIYTPWPASAWCPPELNPVKSSAADYVPCPTHSGFIPTAATGPPDAWRRWSGGTVRIESVSVQHPGNPQGAFEHVQMLHTTWMVYPRSNAQAFDERVSQSGHVPVGSSTLPNQRAQVHPVLAHRWSPSGRSKTSGPTGNHRSPNPATPLHGTRSPVEKPPTWQDSRSMLKNSSGKFPASRRKRKRNISVIGFKERSAAESFEVHNHASQNDFKPTHSCDFMHLPMYGCVQNSTRKDGYCNQCSHSI